MGIYEELGIEPILNLAGTATKLGGPLMSQEVVQAMSSAAASSARIDELQAAASRVISSLTGAEAGYVTSGAASALTLATASCIAGLDIGKMEQLPDTMGRPNEVIISREHRSGYDHAIRAAGARLVEVGMNEQLAGAGARRTETWEYEEAITPKTVAIAYVAGPGGRPSLSALADVCRRHSVPLLVDAAGQLPPRSNLTAYIADGADLVAFSGGKAIRGPQGTGFLVGRRDLIMSAALQHLDLDELWETWIPPRGLIDRERFAGLPRHGIGRGFKVSKEEIVGLIVALREFMQGSFLGLLPKYRDYCQRIARAVDEVTGIRAEMGLFHSEEDFPTVVVHIDPLEAGQSAFDVVRRLRSGTPAVYVGEKGLAEGYLTINPLDLDDDNLQVAIDRLTMALVPDA